MEQKKNKDSVGVRIIDYSTEHQSVFKILNEEWIKAYFKIEEEDTKILNNPKSYIIDKGGYILVAVEEEEILGVCAILNLEQGHYELAKMAVPPKAQGKGIGYLLGKAVVDRVKEIGGNKIYLDSNTILIPAISLYRKLGFKEVQNHDSPYERSNIRMELDLHK